MRTLFRASFEFTLVVALVIAAGITASAQSAKLQLDQLDALANRASETVDVKLDERLMQTTAKFFAGKDPNDAEIRDLIKNVKGIYVKSFTFEKENTTRPQTSNLFCRSFAAAAGPRSSA